MLNLRNKHSVFIPNAAILILERSLIAGRFWSRAGQPLLLSRERMSRNQQNNAFAKVHFNAWVPLNLKLTFFFSKSLSFSSLFAKFSVRLLCGSKRETLMASQKIHLGTGVRKVWKKTFIVETPIIHRFYGFRLFHHLKSPIYTKYNRDSLFHFLSGSAEHVNSGTKLMRILAHYLCLPWMKTLVNLLHNT